VLSFVCERFQLTQVEAAETTGVVVVLSVHASQAVLAVVVVVVVVHGSHSVEAVVVVV
jgi:hypothetical protein